MEKHEVGWVQIVRGLFDWYKQVTRRLLGETLHLTIMVNFVAFLAASLIVTGVASNPIPQFMGVSPRQGTHKQQA